MKKVILIFSLILFGLLFAETSSFRNLATGTAIDDDLDLIYDPIDLHFVSGSRLYTNLSNIINGNEKLLDNDSSDQYLLGFSMQSPFFENLKHSILIEFANRKFGRFVDLDTELNGSFEMYGYGEIGNIYTSYDDIDGDGIYDVIASNTQNKKRYEENNLLRFVLNNSTVWNDLICGLRINVSKNIDKETLLYDLDQTEYNMAEEFNSFDLVENNEDNMDTKSFDLDLLVSMMNPDFKGNELRGNLMLAYSNQDVSSEYIDFDRYDTYDPDVTNYLNYEEGKSEDEFGENTSGIEVGIGTSLRKTLAASEERKNDSYWLVGTHLNFGFYNYKFENIDQENSVTAFYDGLDTLYTDYLLGTDNINMVNTKGEQWMLDYNLFSRYNYQLDEKVYLGIGARLNYKFTSGTYDEVIEINNSENYLQNDEIFDENDYNITETYLEESDVTSETATTNLILPVGLEYKFTKNNKWAVRFGASFHNSYIVDNYSKQVTNADPIVIITEYGDETSTVEIEDNTYSSYSNQRRTTLSSTNYFYGIGFEPTKKLQIDFVGLFDTDHATFQDFVQSLKMSFTLKF